MTGVDIIGPLYDMTDPVRLWGFHSSSLQR